MHEVGSPPAPAASASHHQPPSSDVEPPRMATTRGCPSASVGSCFPLPPLLPAGAPRVGHRGARVAPSASGCAGARTAGCQLAGGGQWRGGGPAGPRRWAGGVAQLGTWREVISSCLLSRTYVCVVFWPMLFEGGEGGRRGMKESKSGARHELSVERVLTHLIRLALSGPFPRPPPCYRLTSCWLIDGWLLPRPYLSPSLSSSFCFAVQAAPPRPALLSALSLPPWSPAQRRRHAPESGAWSGHGGWKPTGAASLSVRLAELGARVAGRRPVPAGSVKVRFFCLFFAWKCVCGRCVSVLSGGIVGYARE